MRNVEQIVRGTLAVVAAVLMIVLAARGAEAQASSTANGTATIDIPQVLAIDVGNTSVSFSNPDIQDFENGSMDATSGSSTIDTRGNIVHAVTISADAEFFSGGDGSKPASDLRWSADGFGSQNVGLTTSGDRVVEGLARGANDGAATLDYRILLDYATDAPDVYSLGFTYTVVAN